MPDEKTKTKCHDCRLIFRDGETICPNCQKQTEVLGTVNARTFWEPSYSEYNPDRNIPSAVELIERRLRREPRRTPPIHPGAERYRHD